MDKDLRNGLWSILTILIWSNTHTYGFAFFECDSKIHSLYMRLWLHYWKLPIDTLKNNWPWVLDHTREYFFKCPWFEVYDFLEFIAANYPYDDGKEDFIRGCNSKLETECSAYRFVGNEIAPITNDNEISAIEDALGISNGPVQTHLHCALEKLSDRKNPDYRNSIKESISAVESLVADVLGQKGTLGNLIKKMESEIGLHPALAKAFSNLYGYTSDEDGIRHAILESSTIDFHDAKFFLVICSSFVSFVKAKIAK
jgi:hypothetical protein